ncbi:hypothetical protein JQ604_21690 [Bradyrhizobium jicamae]|uniref:hypothetical protein n=1 Tax=Bradyrhizobium jicamae TaxID=280332 RepID=UPI001BA78682|nr:hypothetical protein [Bradyrhizobium jicamae]MBR0754807.1 hypothetical protein [Bradyrhizobium jicamae]
MHFIVRLAPVIPAILILSAAHAASPEDKYIAARDAAIAKVAKLGNVKNAGDAADKADEAARADLKTQMTALLAESQRAGFSPAVLNLDTLSKGDQGFGMLDGLRFDAATGRHGAKIAEQRADGSFVEPQSHIIVTTEALFTRWLRGHKTWWDKAEKNVPQQVEQALKFEGLYTQAISTDAAVTNFNELPITKPASASYAYGFLAGRSQDLTPDAGDEVFVAAIAGGKVYIAYGEIEPVKIAACKSIMDEYNKKAEEAGDKLNQGKISKKQYEQLGNLQEKGDALYKSCFVKRAPQEPAFAEATRQAQALLQQALGK